MIRILLSTLLSALPASVLAQAADFSVFEVRRQLAMSNDEKTFKDFYIHAGSEDGVKEGQVYDIIRKVPLYDSYQNKSVGDISIRVAKVHVIFVDKNVCVARYHKEFSRVSIPVLDDNFIMVGDRMDLSTAAKVAENEGAPAPGPEDTMPPVQVVINSIDVSEKVLGSH